TNSALAGRYDRDLSYGLTGSDAIADDDKSASGTVYAGTDTYVFDGDIESLNVNGNAKVFLNGEEIDPSQYGSSDKNTLEIKGQGSDSAYSFSVSEVIDRQQSVGLNPADSIAADDKSASGTVYGGTDTYVFDGDIESLNVNGNAKVFLNGEEIDPANYDGSNQDPSAAFSYSPQDPTAGADVSFDGSGSSDDSSIASYAWDFGDGSSATGANPTHAFESAGDYDVALTVTDDQGATNTLTKTVTVADDGSGGSGELVYAVNTGGPEYTAVDGTVFEADTANSYFSGGQSYSNSQLSDGDIANTEDDPLYLTERSGSGGFDYAFPVDEGTYTVKLHMAEIYWGATGGGAGGEGQRVFDANLEGGEVELDDYDLNAEVDPQTAVTKSYEIEITDGTLNMAFSASTNQPKVSAIEIVEGTDSGSNENPTAAFSYSPQNPAASEDVSFDASGSSDDGSIASYEWDFDGDGQTDATGANPTHAFDSAGDYDVALTVTDDQGATNTVTKTVSVGQSSGSPGSALVEITPGSGNIDQTTYGAGSYQVTNTGEKEIASVSFDLSSATYPDMVFDPQGTAGDPTGEGFNIASDGGTGITTAETSGGDYSAFSQPHNEQNADDGFDVMSVEFDDFQNGETATFWADNDPTSIKGATIGSQEAGPVSGLELARSTVTVEYADGTTQTTQLMGDGSVGGSTAVVNGNEAPAPSIGAQGVSLDDSVLDDHHSGATVSEASQTVTVSGQPGETVTLVRVEGELALSNVPNGGYNIEDLEANNAVNVEYESVTLDSNGEATVPVTLTSSVDDDDEAGFNYFVAAHGEGSDDMGLASSAMVLKYDQSAGGNTAPTIDAIDDQTVTEGDSAIVPISTSDDDGDSVSLSVNGPDFVSVSNGELTIAPESGDAADSPHTVEVTADDGNSGTATESFELTVEEASSGRNGAVFAVNAGGGEYTAADGTVYQADTNFDGGSTFATGNGGTPSDPEITNTEDDTLYYTERYGAFSYNAPVENGEYEVELQFAELYQGVANDGGEGARLFDAAIEGQQVLNDYDIYAETGGPHAAVTETFTTEVTDGELNIGFTKVKDNAKVSAIKVTKVDDSSGGNTAPTIGVIDDQTVTEGDSATVPVSTSDGDGDSVSLSVNGPDFVSLSNGELTIAPEAGDAADSPYTVEVTADDGNGGTATESFQLSVEEESSGGDVGSATVAVNDGAGIGASTYSGGSFEITNTGDKQIESVTFDVSESLVPDAVFDPDGTAGDSTAKQLSIDSESGDGVGVVSTADGDVFSQPHNGQDNAEGYDVMSIGFDDFDAGETVGFSIDLDPTTIKGVSGAGGAGSVSGLEIAASSATVEYADGSTQTTDLASDGSDGGSQATAKADIPDAPTLGVQGVSLQGTDFPGHQAGTVSDTAQTLTLSGPADATVQLTHVVGSEGPSDGYDIDDYEIDSAESVDTQSVTLDSSGEATVQVSLSESNLDYFVASVQDGTGDTGQASDVVILDYEQSGSSGSQALHRVNVGGPEVAATDDGPAWGADTSNSPSQYLVAGGAIPGGTYSVGSVDESVPQGTPVELFQKERYDADQPPEMAWEFADGIESGQTYEVRLYFHDGFSGTDAAGERVFGANIEGGDAELQDFDIIEKYGDNTAAMESFEVTAGSDGDIDIEFLHGAMENPQVNAIEIVEAGQ
ncbi:malectin domain-containing carbohydrate-binding protein, partial [Halococcus agarilyticus]|uniref:malectin domain-containing carbohydrate-binding protein n=1 Tax=Halococcus agarilyticus TaxID=1232219 RepID=UPI0012AC47BE